MYSRSDAHPGPTRASTNVVASRAVYGVGIVVHRTIAGSWQASVIAETSARVGTSRCTRADVNVTGIMSCSVGQRRVRGTKPMRS